MNLVRTVDAAVEPITLAEAKAHCVIQYDDHDAMVAGLIRAARQAAEQLTGRAFIEQTWELKISHFYASRIRLDRVPVLSIESVAYLNEQGVSQTWDAANYQLVEGEPAYLAPAYDVDWPNTRGDAQDVTITYKAGYGTNAAAVPYSIRQAILLMVAHLWEFRTSVSQFPTTPLPMSAESLLRPHRAVLF